MEAVAFIDPEVTPEHNAAVPVTDTLKAEGSVIVIFAALAVQLETVLAPTTV